MSAAPDRAQARPAPLNAEGSSPFWCLRFLGGALRGRTIALKVGPNVLGSAGDCEVLLPGRDVMPHHLSLIVGEVVVSLQKIGAASALLNGEEIRQPRRSVVAGDVVSVGQIEFQLDQAYPVAEQDDSMFAGPQSVLLDDAPPRDIGPAPARWLAGWVGGGVAAVVVLGLAVLAFQGPVTDGPQAGGIVNLPDVEQVLKAVPETEVLAVPGGQVNVKGYVETRQRRQALRDALAPFGTSVSVNVHAVEEMVERARRYVSDPAIAVTYGGQGRLVVSGTVDDESVRQKVRRLSEDLQPTVLVSDKVQVVPKAAKPVAQGDAFDQAAALQRLLPAPVVSITADEHGLNHVQLANGNRYYEGAVLRSGAVLTRIAPDGVTVRGGTEPQAR